MKVFIFVSLLQILYLGGCKSANILVVAPFYGTSHSLIIQSVTSELAKRGHDLTVIATKPLKDPPKNYREIRITYNPKFDNLNMTTVYDMCEMTSFEMNRFMWNMGLADMEFAFNSPSMQDFIKNDKSHFDLVISELFYQEAMYMFAHRYGAPLVLLSTTVLNFHIADFMGSPPPLSYAMHDLYKYDNGESSFGLIFNALLRIYERIGRKYYYLPKVDELAKKHFSPWGIDLPKVEELEKNISLAMINTHFSYDQILPLTPGIVQIGGIHFKDPKPLPQDVQTFLDGGKDGVIYFSFGSILKSSSLRADKMNAFIKAFEKTNLRVVWKWEDDNPPTLKNVLMKKVFPQFDVLAHPNVKVFISHGGTLGTQEALYLGVPIIGIPIYTDQFTNIAKLVNQKIAIRIDYTTMDENVLFKAIDSVLKDPDYSNNAKRVSARFRDKLNDPKEVAMYWIEYVIRHKGSQFLKSPMVYMSFFQYYFIEIITTSIIVLIALILNRIITRGGSRTSFGEQNFKQKSS